MFLRNYDKFFATERFELKRTEKTVRKLEGNKDSNFQWQHKAQFSSQLAEPTAVDLSS